MSGDLGYNYIHFSHENQISFMESWKQFPIPHDDIDTSHLFQATSNIFPLFLLEDEEDGAIPLNSSVFGSKVSKQRNLMKEPQWTDLGLDRLRAAATPDRVPDKTILASLHGDSNNFARFMSNGYTVESSGILDEFGNTTSENWLNMSLDFPTSNTFTKRIRSNSSGQFTHPVHLQTPVVGRTRHYSTDKFQTPITRIVR